MTNQLTGANYTALGNLANDSVDFGLDFIYSIFLFVQTLIIENIEAVLIVAVIGGMWRFIRKRKSNLF